MRASRAACRTVTEGLAMLGLIPRPLRKYLTILWQRYRGDITIVPYASISDYAGILSNPSAWSLLAKPFAQL